MVNDDADPTLPLETGGRVHCFDDEYAGPRWRYGLQCRHLVHYLTTSVSGWILYSERSTDDPRFPFGTIDYSHPLPDDEARCHELEPLGVVWTGAPGLSPLMGRGQA